MSVDEPVTVPDHPAVQWFIEALRSRRPVTADEVGVHFTSEFVAMASAAGIAEGMTKMAVGLKVLDPVSVDSDGAIRILLSPTGAAAPFRVRIGFDGARLTYLDFGPVEIEGITVRAQPPSTLEPHERDAVHRVFDDAYLGGDHGYLDRQLTVLGTIATAWAGDDLVAFALADARVIDLPRLPGQVVRTAGLACVLTTHKRQGISSRLESLAMTGGDAPAALHTLLTSRFAHPAGYHYVRNRAEIVPRPAHAATTWQRDVAAGVAAMLGIAEFNRESFVCRGPGRPVGENVIEMDAHISDEERELFAAVDRSRGDTLLAVWWTTPPPGWGDE